MINRIDFYNNNKEDFNTLEQYVPVVSRVHGKTHPEFYEVEKNYNNIFNKLVNSNEEKISLDDEFNNLKDITNNYKIPEDVCETYEAVYVLLEKLEGKYN